MVTIWTCFCSLFILYPQHCPTTGDCGSMLSEISRWLPLLLDTDPHHCTLSLFLLGPFKLFSSMPSHPLKNSYSPCVHQLSIIFSHVWLFCRIWFSAHKGRREEVCSFPRAVRINDHKLGDYKWQKCIFSQHWYQHIDRAMFSLKILEKNLSLLLPSYWWLLAVLSIPRLVAASLGMAKLVGLTLTPKPSIAIAKSPVFSTPGNLFLHLWLGCCPGWLWGSNEIMYF